MQLKDLPVGAKVRLGTYKVEGSPTEPIIWQVGGVNHYKDGENSGIIDHVTLVTEKIIDLRGFDAKEPANGDSNRRSYGNNRYLHSNIRQWLNKSSQPWWGATHSADAIPNDSGMSQPTGYDDELGFLSNFTVEELEAIIPTKLRVVKPNIDGGGSEIIEDRVFLLSTTEVGLANENNVAEGTMLALFTDSTSRIRTATNSCIKYTKSGSKPSLGAGWYYWLRTPRSGGSDYVRLVDASGSLNYSIAFYGNVGVLPALNLKSDILVSVGPDGVYDLIWSTKYNLIKSASKYYGIEDGKLVNVSPTFESFRDFNVNLVENIGLIKTLHNPSVICYFDGNKPLKLKHIVNPVNEVKFLISKNSVNYFKFKDDNWVEVDKSNILSEGMTKGELENISQVEWEGFSQELHLNSFEILVGMYSETPNTPLIKRVEVVYVENDAPIILEAEIVPDNIHNAYATLNANVKDYEGDKISFKVLIKKANATEFIQVSPENGWFERNTSNTEITQSFNFPYFDVGLNQIKLVVKDERGRLSEFIGNITLLNTNPTILITHDDTQMTAVIGDEDGDMVAYKLSINNKAIFDYTEFQSPPVEFKYLFDSTVLNFGEMNKVRLNAKDTFGGEISEEINVLGTYRGLMFKNEAGEYFVDDHGNILMDLLFDEVLIGGQTSPTKKVILENRNGFPIKNTKVSLPDSNFVTGAWVELSETEMPFIPKDIISIPGIMANLTTKDFYIRVRSDRAAHKGGYFYIDGKADPN